MVDIKEPSWLRVVVYTYKTKWVMFDVDNSASVCCITSEVQRQKGIPHLFRSCYYCWLFVCNFLILVVQWCGQFAIGHQDLDCFLSLFIFCFRKTADLRPHDFRLSSPPSHSRFLPSQSRHPAASQREENTGDRKSREISCCSPVVVVVVGWFSMTAFYHHNNFPGQPRKTLATE